MATLNAVIKWADNTATLQANLVKGADSMDAAKQSAEKMVNALSGTGMSLAIETTTSLTDWFKNLGTQIVATAGGFLTAQAVISAGTKIWDAYIGLLTSSVQSFADAESAQTKLTAALRAQHLATPEVIAQYNELATTFQDTTVYGDDLITSMEALLVQVGGIMPGQMRAALQASADLASGLGIDLESATNLVAKAAAGHTETLGKYGIQVSESALRTKGFDAVLEAINRQFGGQAAAQVDTYSGKVAQMANSWDNMKEAIGKFIVTNPIIESTMRAITNALETGDKKAGAFGTSLEELAKKGHLGGYAEIIGFLERYISHANEVEKINQRLLDMPSPFEKVAKDMAKLPDPGGLAFYQQTIDAEKAIADNASKVEAAAKKADDAIKAFRKTLEGVITTSTNYATVIDTVDGKVTEGVKFYLARGAAVGDLATVYGLATEQVEAIKRSMDAETDLLDQATDAMDRNREMTVAAAGAIGDANIMMEDFGKALSSIGSVGSMGLIVDHTKEAADRMKEARTNTVDWHSALDSIDTVLTGINNKFAQTATVIARTIDTVITKFSEGDWLGAISAGIAGAISVIGGLFKSAESKINPLRQKFVEAAGGMDALRDHATAAGTTIDALLQAKNAEQYEAAVNGLTEAFEALDEQLTLVAQIEADVQAGFTTLQGAIETAHGAMSESMRETLRSMAEIPGVSDSVKAALLGLANDTTPNFAELEQKAKDLGIDLAALGPIFQQAHVNDEALTLINTFEGLRDAGADVGGVINGMADEVQAVVDTSLQFKTTIPENMRWMIEALIASNQLFDDQGALITDITKLKFGDPVTTEADKIVAAIEALGDILKGLPGIAEGASQGIADALANIHPGPIHVPVVFDYPSSPAASNAASGGLVTAHGIQYLGAGGNVLPFRPRGSDTVPAMLTPGEEVIPVGGRAREQAPVVAELRALRRDLPQVLAVAVRDEMQKANRGRR